MAKRKPETLVLAVALVGTLTVLMVFLGDLILAHHRDLDAGKKRLQHFGLMMSEHTARTFESVDVLLREMATDLSGRRNWESWAPAQGWEYVAQRQSRAMPQLRNLALIDHQGEQRFVSTYFSPAPINLARQPFFSVLAEGAEAATYGPYIGHNSGRYTYVITRRVNTGDGRFTGAAFAAIEPAYLQDFCWSNRMSDDFESVLVNTQGQIIASCRPSDLSRQSRILGAKAGDVLFDGRLHGQIPESGFAETSELIVAVAPVPGFPDLRIVTAIPRSTLLSGWQSRLIELGTLGALVAGVLLFGALRIRRQVREMARIAAELAESHELLEERVQQATLELAGRKDAAERANTAKSRFLAAASHDLRQPLHALSLFAADLQRQIRNGHYGELPRLGDHISASTSALGELLDSLLDISRLDVAGIKPDPRPFALAPMFERLADSFRRAAADKDILLRIRTTERWVETDPVMLERMLGNLIANAIRYTPNGGRVLVCARKRGGSVQLEVRDSGIGIAAEHQAAIFGEFYQVGNSAREQNKGLGLGLSIVDRLARALDIAVALRSRLGEGTTFLLRVPGAAPRPMTVPEPAAAAPAAERVLCIGDGEHMEHCASLLGDWGYAVERGAGVVAALPHDAVVIIDVTQSAELGPMGQGISLIALGAEAGTELPPDCHALPVPVRPAKLRALVSQLQKTLSKSMP